MKTVNNFNSKIATLLLGLSMFLTGASGLVSEYVLSTVSTYILGNSIEQFSITIALMMGMMGLGGWSQKFLSDDNLIEKFIVIEITLTILGAFAPIAIYLAFGYMDNFALIYYSFVMFIGFLIGFEIPFIIRINEKYSNDLKANLSIVMAADYIGSFIGALVWIYILLPHLPLTKISFVITALNFIIAVMTYTYFRRSGLIKTNIKIPVTIIISTIVLIFGFTNVTKWEFSLEQKLYEDPVISSQTTKYQHLTITQNKKLDEYRLYINGNVQFSSLDERRYHEQLVHPIMSLNTNSYKKVLVIGGGDGLVVRELNKYENISSVTLVDLDPGIIQFAKTNEVLKKLNNNAFDNAKITVLNNKAVTPAGLNKLLISNSQDKENKNTIKKHLSVINIDADLFLNSLKVKEYDVVIIDLPDPSSIELVKLYSKQFYLKLKRVMKNDAMFIIQSTSSYHAKEAYLMIGRTIESAGFDTIPLHMNIPSFGEWGWFIAWKNGSYSKNEFYSKVDKLKKFDVNTSYLTPNVFRASMVFGKKELLTDNSDINTLMQPKLLQVYTENSWLNY
jgi:spermidine synthase